MLRAAAVAAASLLVPITSARADEPTSAAPASSAGEPSLRLDLASALAMANSRAPSAAVRRERIREAESRRVQAEVYPATNPVLDAEIGPRIAGSDASPTVGVGLSQTFELGARVRARTAIVDADVAAATADGDRDLLLLSREVATAFERALWARARAERATSIETIAVRLVDTATRKKAAGDATILDVNVARGSLARARADRIAITAELERALGELRILLGLSPDTEIALGGTLEQSVAPASASPLDPERHPLVRAARADLARANAEIDLGDALAYPDLGVGVRYETDEANVHTVLGTLSITLPIFERGQGVGAEGRARAARAQAELGAARKLVAAGLATTASVTEARRAAASAFEQEGGVTSFADNVALATKALEAGEMSLGDVLLLRRELIDTELDRLDRLLELRLAEIDLRFARGGAP